MKRTSGGLKGWRLGCWEFSGNMSDTAKHEEKKHCQPTIGGTIALAFLSLIGIFIHLCTTSSTVAFLSYGVVWGLMMTFAMAVIVVPMLLTIHFLLWAIRRKRSLPIWLNNRNLFRLGLAFAALGTVVGLCATIPKVRYRKHVGIASSEVSSMKAEGFDSFLARRWVFSFKVTPQGRDEIVSGLNLQIRDRSNPVGSPEEDMFFKHAKVPWIASLPRPEDSQTYVRASEKGLSAVAWITFVYDPETGNAWLYKGYSN